LRQFDERDWDDLHRMFEDQECVRYTIKTPLTHWQTWRTLAGYVGHWSMRGYGPYAVVEKSSGKMMGQLDYGIPAIGQSRRSNGRFPESFGAKATLLRQHWPFRRWLFRRKSEIA
jgi:RimJ/RimL family protein N-acetyltransferase